MSAEADLSERARAPKLRGIGLEEACRMTLERTGGMGGRCAGISAGGDASHGRSVSANPFRQQQGD